MIKKIIQDCCIPSIKYSYSNKICKYMCFYPIYFCCVCSKNKKYNELTFEDKVEALGEVSFKNESFMNIQNFKEIPQPNNWLDNVNEYGQTVKNYKKQVKKFDKNGIIYLNFLDNSTINKDELIEFIKIWFQREVIIIEENIVDFGDVKFREFNETKQYLVSDINKILNKKKRDYKNSICLFAITEKDLYPDEDWNYVFGESLINGEIGTLSLFRFLNSKKIYKLIAHEIGHIFGLEHCIYYSCCMNGIMSSEDLDVLPDSLCPIDLNKLYYSMDLDIKKRQNELIKFHS